MDKHEEVAVILAVDDVDKLSLPLRRRFSLEIELAVPSLRERIEILEIIFKNCKNVDSDAILNLASNTHGYTGSDLRCIQKLVFAAGLDVDKNVLKDRIVDATKKIRPTGIREIVLEVPDSVLWPQRFPESFARFNIPAPSGILLYGPPGCCKTMVARALASQSQLNFLAVKGPEVFSKWVGESERAIRDLFRRARQVAPAVLFFDEIDAVAASRGDKNSGVGDRVLAQLLTELDGLEKKCGVIVLAATNRPDMLDGAILRPGRLDKTIYVPLPDADARYPISLLFLLFCLRNLRPSFFSNRPCIGSKSILSLQSKNIDRCDYIEELVERTEGYSGAEVVAVYRCAALVALKEDKNSVFLERKHFMAALSQVVPRTESRLLALYKNFKLGHCI
ncbi:unnamed protein product [Enterobius vermicularis]|uniref:AAA domain-containing protein n=1 Tax=Enterobius vermicularis TaxID=51028 RepID=A0A0N4VM78_ENTVE|nr:unnamed protein product [Enterobius vermicularis]